MMRAGSVFSPLSTMACPAGFTEKNPGQKPTLCVRQHVAAPAAPKTTPLTSPYNASNRFLPIGGPTYARKSGRRTKRVKKRRGSTRRRH